MPKSVATIRHRTKALHEQWVFRSQIDPQFGGPLFDKNLELAKQVIKTYGTKQFNDFLNITGHGSHPEVIRIFWKIGQALARAHTANDNFLTKSPPKTIGELFYPGFDGDKR